MVMAQDPELLLVDEPVAGMTPRETEKTGELLMAMARHHTLVVIEHDMTFVRQIAQTVTVLDEGKILCEGTVDEVQNNPQVIEVYLGRRQGNERRPTPPRRPTRRQHANGVVAMPHLSMANPVNHPAPCAGRGRARWTEQGNSMLSIRHTVGRLWRVGHRPRRRYGHRAGPDRLPHGPQRRRQDHPAQGDHGPARLRERHGFLRGPGLDATRSARTSVRPRGHRLCPAGTGNLPPPDGRRKPADRPDRQPRQTQDDPGARLRIFPDAQRHAPAQGRRPQRRPAAATGHRPRPRRPTPNCSSSTSRPKASSRRSSR